MQVDQTALTACLLHLHLLLFVQVVCLRVQIGTKHEELILRSQQYYFPFSGNADR